MPHDSLIAELLASAELERVFGAENQAQCMLDFESALARVEARLGIIPQSAARAIADCCEVRLYDLGRVAAATARAGNPAIPLVRELTALVEARHAEAARYVHWGATSQDVLDTGLMLQCRAALAHLDARLARLCGQLAALAERHASTPMVGRTLLQHALPITFGLKVAN